MEEEDVVVVVVVEFGVVLSDLTSDVFRLVLLSSTVAEVEVTVEEEGGGSKEREGRVPSS